MRNKAQTGLAASGVLVVVILASLFGRAITPHDVAVPELPPSAPAPAIEERAEGSGAADSRIQGTLQKGETLASLFSRNGLSAQVVDQVSKSSRKVFNFRRMRAGNEYAMHLLEDGSLENFEYTIDALSKVLVYSDPESPHGFVAENIPIVYNIEYAVIRGTIEDNLVNSLSDTMEPDRLAIDLSEIFAWDLDFTTDLRKGASYEMLVEERWLDGSFSSYGQILVAHFANNGEEYHGYYFDGDPQTRGYYDMEGRPLRRGFLSSPLRYKYISSRFSHSRLHPVLKIRRPHLGVDYAAPAGTPVSAASSGVVRFAGRKGGFGKLIILKHPTGHETYYGHLSRFGKGVRSGAATAQGDVIGYVGSTGLSTGPHLDYRVKLNGYFVDPLKLKTIRLDPLSGETLASFKASAEDLSMKLRESRYAFLRTDQNQQSAAVGPLSDHSL